MTVSLCFHCEHRAEYLDARDKDRPTPRFECSDTANAVGSCYMFRPTIPPILKRDKGDKRPTLAGWMLSARSHAERLPKTEKEIQLNYKKVGSGYFLYWEPSDRMVERALKLAGSLESKKAKKVKAIKS